ncbi:hypothetical protein PENTCL1PPCAC_5648, partial [Pristionchus entomophagus]
MKDASKCVRPSKRHVIVFDDDESTNEQPSAKSVKREEERDVITVGDEESTNDEQDYHAEKNRADDLEKRLTDVSSRLENTKKRAENVFAAKVELTRENETLKMKLAELKRSARQSDSVNSKLQLKLAEVSTQLEEARKRAVSHPELELENETLKAEMAKMRYEHQG